MAEKDEEGTVKTIVIGGMAALAGTALGMLLAAKPAEAAPPDEKIDYLLQLLEQLAQGNVTIIGLLEQLVTAAGIPGVPGVEVTVKAPWVAKIPEQIYSHDIRVVGTFYSDVMVDWTKGKRLIFVVQSSLNQVANIQPIGNYVDDVNLAVDINGAWPCPANSNISIGFAWDDWHPFVGVRITTAVAPTAGILNIWAVIQE